MRVVSWVPGGCPCPSLGGFPEGVSVHDLSPSGAFLLRADCREPSGSLGSLLSTPCSLGGRWGLSCCSWRVQFRGSGCQGSPWCPASPRSVLRPLAEPRVSCWVQHEWLAGDGLDSQMGTWPSSRDFGRRLGSSCCHIELARKETGLGPELDAPRIHSFPAGAQPWAFTDF